MLCQLSCEAKSVRVCGISELSLVPSVPMCVLMLCTQVNQLAEHWTGIPKIAGSIPTVVRQTVQLARCGYTHRVTSETFNHYTVKENNRM